LDEPFGALDAKVRKELRQWLRRLHDEISVTSVFVTHDQEEALEVADRVVVMNQGRIEQIGAPDEVFHRPATAFVIDFLGDVNLFRGRVESGHAVFGSLTVSQEDAADDGKPARLFVRPYDLEVHAEARSQSAIRARITRVLTAGPSVRLELEDESGTTFVAEIPHDHFRQARWQPNDHVYVTVRDARLFVDEVAIPYGNDV
jgi:sulfate transport system ATP-binding protein